jgi:hypothetical protein
MNLAGASRKRVFGQRPLAFVPTIVTERRSIWLAVTIQGDTDMRWNSHLLLAAIILASSATNSNFADASEIAISSVPQSTTTTTTINTVPAAAKAGSGGVTTKVEKQTKSGGGSSTNASIPNSSENYLDDRLAWPSAIEAKTSLSGDFSNGYCIPANTKVIGAHAGFDTSVQQTPASDSAGPGTSASQYQAVTLDTNHPYLSLFGPRPKKVGPPGDAATACPDVKTPQAYFSPGDLAYISTDDMKNVGYRAGFDYGALIVPFKMQLAGGKAFTGSASVGGYVGYQNPIANLGVNVSPIVFGGASNISTSKTNGSGTSSQTVAGLSYGVGLLFDIKDSFQAGFVLGFDHVSSAQKYQFNDKPWVSFEIGYSFAN